MDPDKKTSTTKDVGDTRPTEHTPGSKFIDNRARSEAELAATRAAAADRSKPKPKDPPPPPPPPPPPEPKKRNSTSTGGPDSNVPEKMSGAPVEPFDYGVDAGEVSDAGVKSGVGRTKNTDSKPQGSDSPEQIDAQGTETNTETTISSAETKNLKFPDQAPLLTKITGHFGLTPDDDQALSVLDEILKAKAKDHVTIEDLVNDFDTDEDIAAILDSYDVAEEPEVVEADVVDPNDGIQADEEDALFETLKSLSPEKRQALLDRLEADDFDARQKKLDADIDDMGSALDAVLPSDERVKTPLSTLQNILGGVNRRF